MAANELLDVLTRLHAKTKRLRFSAPVAWVYYPLDYAWPVAKAYVERFGHAPKEVLFLGMNPGPFGMGQTGVPFGEVAAVRDFLRLEGEIAAPEHVHPKRPVLGWGSTRSEVSGQRLWGAIAKKHKTPERFFERAFILNYCPLLFLAESGANLTPDKLAKAERTRLEAICDQALAETIAVLKPQRLVGVGLYAVKRFRAVVAEDREVIVMPHPSPASPAANRGWEAAAKRALRAAGLTGLL